MLHIDVRVAAVILELDYFVTVMMVSYFATTSDNLLTCINT